MPLNVCGPNLIADMLIYSYNELLKINRRFSIKTRYRESTIVKPLYAIACEEKVTD